MEKKTKYEYVKEWRKNNPEKYKAQKKRARERKKEKEKMNISLCRARKSPPSA